MFNDDLEGGGGGREGSAPLYPPPPPLDPTLHQTKAVFEDVSNDTSFLYIGAELPLFSSPCISKALLLACCLDHPIVLGSLVLWAAQVTGKS